jgi:uncharacterized membrane protein YvbJ
MFCSKCGTEHSEDSQFCRKCGQRLTVSSAAPEPEPKHSSRSRRTPLFLLLVLIALVIFYYAGDTNHQERKRNITVNTQ